MRGIVASSRSQRSLRANQTIELPYYLNLALDNGVKPSEISEIITHLAFYSGWANAMSSVAVAKEIFAARKISADQLSPTSDPLPLDEAAEADRVTRVGQQFGAAFPGIVQYTTDILFRDLWLRPGLAPRDRSLVTVAALIAASQVAQMPYHLNRAKWSYTRTSRRGDHAPCVLCWLAKRIFCHAGCEGRVRETR